MSFVQTSDLVHDGLHDDSVSDWRQPHFLRWTEFERTELAMRTSDLLVELAIDDSHVGPLRLVSNDCGSSAGAADHIYGGSRTKFVTPFIKNRQFPLNAIHAADAN